MVRMEVGKRYRREDGEEFRVKECDATRTGHLNPFLCSDGFYRREDGTWGDSSSKHLRAVECLDDPQPPSNVTTEGPYGWLNINGTNLMVGPGFPVDRPQTCDKKVSLASLSDADYSKLKQLTRDGYNIAYAEGQKSRDAEVAALKQRIVELLYSLESATERADELESEAEERDEATPFLHPDDLAIRIDSGNAVQIVLYAEDESKTKVAGVVALDSDQIEKLGTLLDWIGCDA